LLKEEIKEIFALYLSETKLSENVNIEVLADMCVDLTGADVKSVVCDALVRAFHRAHKSLASESVQDDPFDMKISASNDSEAVQMRLQESIVIDHVDLVTSIETVRKTINKTERLSLKRM
jgi:SpoVK/Ycf46/Vps4 family AAA+-type ATPase